MDTTLLAHADPLSCVVVVLLVDVLKLHRAWGWMRLVAGPAAYKTVPGLLGVKVMGSGHGGGFTLRPSATHQGLLCRFDSANAAMDFLHGEQVQAFRERARECWAGLLTVQSARGTWDQQAWGLSDPSITHLSGHWGPGLPEVSSDPPLAVLTRASIHTARASTFWRHAPATQAALEAADGCLLAMGLGEAPLVRQCTFSLWRGEADMNAYAREGAHQQASTAAYRQRFFAESMFVRMRVLRMAGHWQGQDLGNTLGWPEVAHG